MANSKSRAQELSNDVSFVIFGHKTWDLEGRGQIGPPPQHILVFKYPSRDRGKIKEICYVIEKFVCRYERHKFFLTYVSQMGFFSLQHKVTSVYLGQISP